MSEHPRQVKLSSREKSSNKLFHGSNSHTISTNESGDNVDSTVTIVSSINTLPALRKLLKKNSAPKLNHNCDNSSYNLILCEDKEEVDKEEGEGEEEGYICQRTETPDADKIDVENDHNTVQKKKWHQKFKITFLFSNNKSTEKRVSKFREKGKVKYFRDSLNKTYQTSQVVVPTQDKQNPKGTDIQPSWTCSLNKLASIKVKKDLESNSPNLNKSMDKADMRNITSASSSSSSTLSSPKLSLISSYITQEEDLLEKSGDKECLGREDFSSRSVTSERESIIYDEDYESYLESTVREPFLEPQRVEYAGKKTLVLDLDETLIHSSFQPIRNAAFTINIEIDGDYYDVYVLKRPGVDKFLNIVTALYEVVIFTASLSQYANPLLDRLDPMNKCPYRLFRENCTVEGNSYIKDLSKLGRPLKDIIIIDNSPISYILQPENAIPISSW